MDVGKSVKKAKIFVFLAMAGESVRAVYERARRKRLVTERRSYQVLSPWLRITHPEVFAEFEVFFGHLCERNTNTKNLTTTEDFKYFCRLGKCVYCFVVVIIKLLCLL